MIFGSDSILKTATIASLIGDIKSPKVDFTSLQLKMQTYIKLLKEMRSRTDGLASIKPIEDIQFVTLGRNSPLIHLKQPIKTVSMNPRKPFIEPSKILRMPLIEPSKYFESH